MEERKVRIGNRSRLFWTHGKSIFNKKTTSTDDSVKTEEKEALLSEPENNGEIPDTEEIISGTEIIELGKKFSPYLTNLRKVLEEGKLFPSTRDWVDSALPILGNCIEITSQNKRKDLEQLFLDIARIIYSADRVGKCYLSVDPALELYSLLCCVVADFMKGKPNRPMFEQWTKSYQKVINDFSNLGIRLVDDNEEPITTPTSENETNYTISDNIVSSLTNDETKPQDILPSTDDIVPQIPEDTNIEIPQQETPMGKNIYSEQNIETTESTNDTINETSSPYIVETTSPETIDDEKTALSENISPSEKILPETPSTTFYEENKTSTETTLSTPMEIQKKDIETHTLLQQINQIPQNEVKEIILDTLKAIVEGTPETAKAKAIELAKEMAKLEVEKVKTDYRGTEYQIESLSSEINQVEEQLNICQNEIKTIQEELKEQISLTQKTEKEKKDLENNIEKTQNKIEDIEKRIFQLLQEKEAEIINLNRYKKDLTSKDKSIEELKQTISTFKESIQDFENQAITLLQRMDLLEKTKSEKENLLSQLQKQIKEREKTVRRLEETLRILYISDENYSSGNTSLLNDTNNENTIDLFNGEM